MTRLFARCLVLLLVASLCFAVFTIGTSAADSVQHAGCVADLLFMGAHAESISVYAGLNSSDSSSSHSGEDYYSGSAYLTFMAPSAGTLIVSLAVSGPNVMYSQPSSLGSNIVCSVSNSGLTFTVTFTDTSLSVQVPRFVFYESFVTQPSNLSVVLSLVSWSGTGSGGGDTPVDPYPSSGSRWILTDNKGNWVAGESGQEFLSTSSNWQTYSQYIGEYVTKVKYSRDGTETEENSEAFISHMLSSLAYSTWDWSVSDGKLIFFPPEDAEGSWLDNLWRMNVTIYYNLVNNSGWFGMVTSNQSSIISQLGLLNTRVLQILSVLANDEDVKIKDATTDHRNWITDYFEDSSGASGKPQTSDNDAVNDSMNEVRDQFQSDYSAGDIGSIFSASSYDNNLWYSFWSQSVSDDVNGTSRGGMGGGRARAQSNSSRWADRYDYGDDTIVDMFGFGGADDG